MNKLTVVFALILAASTPALGQSAHAGHQSHDPATTDHSTMDHSTMDHTTAAEGRADSMSHEMAGALGRYSMSREASGTSWQPDASIHAGVEGSSDDWMLMGHVLLNGVYDWQEGPRGDEKTFVSGMLMGMARRELGQGTLQFRGMLSPDPLMGKRGLPVLLASGETAHGETTLIDRQHPHDMIMELAASYSYSLTETDSVFLYGGLPGEPAFGPPAFMHRLSIMDSPEPPISHHWLDSTHITFGVVTLGYVHDNWKLEASRFHGREPDQFRYDFDTGPLDSTAVRLSWNPTRELSFQVSWADVTSPEQLTPAEDQRKWSASGIYTRQVGAAGWWSTTAAWGRRSGEHDEWLDAYILESALHPNDEWTVFARAEHVENNELLTTGDEHHGPTFTVNKASIGAIRDFALAEHVKVGVGALYALNFVPEGLEAAYGSSTPSGAMAFVRLKIE